MRTYFFYCRGEGDEFLIEQPWNLLRIVLFQAQKDIVHAEECHYEAVVGVPSRIITERK